MEFTLISWAISPWALINSIRLFGIMASIILQVLHLTPLVYKWTNGLRMLSLSLAVWLLTLGSRLWLSALGSQLWLSALGSRSAFSDSRAFTGPSNGFPSIFALPTLTEHYGPLWASRCFSWASCYLCLWEFTTFCLSVFLSAFAQFWFRSISKWPPVNCALYVFVTHQLQSASIIED